MIGGARLETEMKVAGLAIKVDYSRIERSLSDIGSLDAWLEANGVSIVYGIFVILDL